MGSWIYISIIIIIHCVRTLFQQDDYSYKIDHIYKEKAYTKQNKENGSENS